MSFRGGFRNGNSGNNNFNIPVGIAYQDILSQSQLHNSEVPKLSLPVNNPTISYRERLVASYCITHLNDLSDSVFNLDDTTKDDKKVKNSNFIEVDNSNDIERYGDRYLKHKKTFNGVESLTDHPFVKDLFPEELYNVMGFNKKKLLNLKRFKNNSGGNNGIIGGGSNSGNVNGSGGDGDDMNPDADGNGQDKLGLSMLEKLKELAEEVGNDVVIGSDVNENDDDNDENKENQRKSVMDEIEDDDDFEDDEDDDDDYNAEKYFNDGDDDDGYGDMGDDDNEPIF